LITVLEMNKYNIAIGSVTILALMAYARERMKIQGGSRAVWKPKNGRWYPFIYGDRHGSYEIREEPILGFRREGFDWEMAASMYSKNEWKNWSVEGATQYNKGFIDALRDISGKHPEAMSFLIRFDGPWMLVSELLHKDSSLVWLHGTSSVAYEKIAREGLQPRRQTKAKPAYGAHISSAPPSDPNCVYLTTQENAAQFAAAHAARAHGGDPIILQVLSVDESLLEPDEDSKTSSWRESLDRLGSVKYCGSIHPTNIKKWSKNES